MKQKFNFFRAMEFPHFYESWMCHRSHIYCIEQLLPHKEWVMVHAFKNPLIQVGSVYVTELPNQNLDLIIQQIVIDAW